MITTAVFLWVQLLIFPLSYMYHKKWCMDIDGVWERSDMIRSIIISFLFWWAVLPWKWLNMNRLVGKIINWLNKPLKDDRRRKTERIHQEASKWIQEPHPTDGGV